MGKSKSNAAAVYGGQGVPGFAVELKPSKPTPQPAVNQQKVKVESNQTSASAYATMLANPLAAQPVGRPDSTTMSTNVCRIRDVYDVVSNATGYAACGIAPHVAGSYATAALTGAAAVFSAGAGFADSQYAGQLNADNKQIRTLCYVVEWIPQSSDNVMSGRVFLGQYPDVDITKIPDQNVPAYFDDEGMASSAKHNATTIVRPWKDNDFVSPAGAQSNVPVTVFVASGLPFTATVGQLIVTRIIELIPKGTVLARFTAVQTVCDPMACCQANNIVGRDVTYASGDNASGTLAAKGLKLLAVIARTVHAFNTGGMSEISRMIN